MASSWCRKATSLVVFGLMGVTGTGIYDDYLIFKQCSTKAIAKARNDRRLMMMIGEYVDQGPWYESMKATPQHAASPCTVPTVPPNCVFGLSATKIFHLEEHSLPHNKCVTESPLSSVDVVVGRAERLSSQFYYVWPGQGQWEMLVVEALVPQPKETIRIDLLHNP